MNDRLLSLRVFVRVARLGSFSRAAREFGLSQPSISRLMAELERDIGVALLVRTTRAVALTEAGQDYLARIDGALATIDEAGQAARGGEELSGTLRVGVSSGFGRREIIPRLPTFLAEHPKLRLELRVSDRHQDLVAEGVDLAFRLGAMANSTLLSRRLGSTPRVVAAAPAYLRQRGTPAHPADLADHDVIVGPGKTGAADWLFRQGSRVVAARVSGRFATDENEAAVTAAVAGLGITITSLFGCRAELTRGDLIRVLGDWDLDPVELHAVFPPSAYPKRAAGALADHMTLSCTGA